jgi:tellurite resistance protein
MKITRRKLAAALVAASAVPAQAQTPAPDDDLKTARDRMRANAAVVANQSVPMATEPAFQFKA